MANTYQYRPSASPHTYAQGPCHTPASVSSWGTISTHAPLPKVVGSPSTYSFGLNSPPNHLYSPVTSMSSQRGDSYENSSQYYALEASRSPSGSMSSVGTLPRSGPSQPDIAIIPSLRLHAPDNQRLQFDLSRPPSKAPSTYNYYPDMLSSAFHPSMTYAHITIHGPVLWSFRVHTPQAMTVYDVLKQIYYFLQGSDGHQASLSSRMKPNPLAVGDYRDHNAMREGYGNGVKRLDLLGPRHFLAGFESAVGDNSWNVYLTLGRL